MSGWVFDFRSKVGAATGVTGIFTAVAVEVAATSEVEVAVKEPKLNSMGLARMSAMLAGKMTPDRVTMLHSEFPITPTWHANYQEVRPKRL
jgi:hypothetical protein